MGKPKIKLLPSPGGFKLPFAKQKTFKFSHYLALSFTEEEFRAALVGSKTPMGKEIFQVWNFNVNETPEETIAEKLQAALSELKLADVNLIGAVASHGVITRNLEIPSKDPSEIREILNLQASRHTPYSRSEIVIDYLNLGVFKTVYTKVLLVIVPRLVVKRFYDFSEKLKRKRQRNYP